jgi:hypothetical protein
MTPLLQTGLFASVPVMPFPLESAAAEPLPSSNAYHATRPFDVVTGPLPDVTGVFVVVTGLLPDATGTKLAVAVTLPEGMIMVVVMVFVLAMFTDGTIQDVNCWPLKALAAMVTVVPGI